MELRAFQIQSIVKNLLSFLVVLGNDDLTNDEKPILSDTLTDLNECKKLLEDSLSE